MSAAQQGLRMLAGASQRIRQCGWTQGAYLRGADDKPLRFRDLERSKRTNTRAEASAYCLVGAVRAAAMTARLTTRQPARAATLDDAEELALAALAKATGGNVNAWNDAAGRTKADALALLELVQVNFRREHGLT